MPNTTASLWAATITLLAGAFYFFSAVRVGILRGRHNIKAPATSGHPQFDRAYRVQLNTLEQMGIILPFLWVAAFYPLRALWIAPLIALLWLFGRVIYLVSYMADPEKRLLGAGLCGACNLAMLIVALLGVSRVWMAGGVPT